MLQIITGVLLAVHYTSDIQGAFYSVEFIMRNVQNGWLVRYMHSSGASFLFLALYCHILRSLYYRTFRNTATWLTGLILFLLMMATGFLGYVLVWGQMCGKDGVNMLEGRIFHNQNKKKCSKSRFSLLKHLFFDLLHELIIKNP